MAVVEGRINGAGHVQIPHGVQRNECVRSAPLRLILRRGELEVCDCTAWVEHESDGNADTSSGQGAGDICEVRMLGERHTECTGSRDASGDDKRQ